MKPAVVGVFLAFALCLAAQQQPAKESDKAATEKPAEKAAPAPPAEPRDYREVPYIYDINGNPVPAPGSRQQRLGAGPNAPVHSEDLAVGTEGRAVVVRRGEEQVLSSEPDDRKTERVIQRYDTMGQPTRKQVIKSERKKMPDGTVQTIDVLYDQDVNGQLQFWSSAPRRRGRATAADTRPPPWSGRR